MFSRGSARLCCALRADNLAPGQSHSCIFRLSRHVHRSSNIRDSFPNGQSSEGGSQTIALSHPLDPSNSVPSTSSLNTQTVSGSSSPSVQHPAVPSHSPPRNNISKGAVESQADSNLPTPYMYPSTSQRPSYTNPPFDTHAFFKALERTFPVHTAQGLMRATRALLVDRIGKVKREALTTKDLDNQAYLFRAALSELHAELSTNTKNDAAAISSATSGLRREVDQLDVKMKEDIGNLKHEIQMELDSRKNETKADLKQQDIAIEEVLNKAIVNVSDLRTDVEEIKWENMRRAVVTLGAFVIVIVVGMEIQPRAPKPSPPHLPPPPDESNPFRAGGSEGT